MSNKQTENEDMENISDFTVSVVESSDEIKHDLRYSILQSSDADSEISIGGGKSVKNKLYCDPCKDERKFLPAEGFCVNCDEYLCVNCISFHKKQKALKLHILKDKPNMPKERTNVNAHDVSIDKCPSHTDKVIEYFCQSCDKLGCSVCIVTEHRACKDVDFIPDIIEGIESSEEYTNLIDNMQGLSVNLHHHTNRVASNIERSVEYRRKAKEKVRNQRAEINKLFDELELEIHSKVDDIYNEDNRKLSSISDLVNTLTKEVSEMGTDLKRKSRTRCQLFVAMKQAKQKMQDFEMNVKTLEAKNKVQNFEYTQTNIIQDELVNAKLGKVDCLSSETARVASQRPCNIIGVQHIQDYTDVLYRGTGLCLLTNNRLALIDSQHDTCKLIDVNQNRMVFYFQFDSVPFDATKLPDSQLAVTFPDRGEIKVFNVSSYDTMNELRTVDVGRGCCGVHHSEGKLIVCFKKCYQSKPRIKILDTKGTELNLLENDDFGRPLFTSPYYITVSPDGSTIYVSDKGSKSITAMTMNGKVKAIHRMETPTGGIAVDEAGSVYVCAIRDNYDVSMQVDIVQLSEYCEKVHTLAQLDEHYGPIAFCDENKVFYLAGMSALENNHVLVVNTACDSKVDKS